MSPLRWCRPVKASDARHDATIAIGLCRAPPGPFRSYRGGHGAYIPVANIFLSSGDSVCRRGRTGHSHGHQTEQQHRIACVWTPASALLLFVQPYARYTLRERAKMAPVAQGVPDAPLPTMRPRRRCCTLSSFINSPCVYSRVYSRLNGHDLFHRACATRTRAVVKSRDCKIETLPLNERGAREARSFLFFSFLRVLILEKSRSNNRSTVLIDLFS